jgi:hypothetical protein
MKIFATIQQKSSGANGENQGALGNSHWESSWQTRAPIRSNNGGWTNQNKEKAGNGYKPTKR